MMNITKLDRVFSTFIRMRDAKDGIVTCISCGKRVEWKKSHCGHYINRQHLATRWDEFNCNGQCISCNSFDEGNIQGYRRGLIKKIGEKATDMLEIKKHNTCHMNQAEVNILTKYYENKIKLL